MRLFTRNGYDWSDRFPLIRAGMAALQVRSCLIDGEAVCGISALRLGEVRGGKLMYAGKVGTGWGRDAAADIRAKLDQLIRPKAPLDERIRKPDTRWVEPRFLADVEFAEISDDGRVRHPLFAVSRSDRTAESPSPSSRH